MIEEALISVRHRIDAAMIRSGRVDKVTLVGVTKNQPLDAIEKAVNLGLSIVGENRVQEGRDKISQYRGSPVDWHLIGHLQMNKVKQAVTLFSLIHSVDTEKVLAAIDKEAGKAGKVQEILLQINIAEEASKSGMPIEKYPHIRDMAKTLPHVKVRGLMCMAPFYENPEEARPIFKIAYALYDDMKRYFPEGQIAYLSMGMSHDFEVAIEEGANLLRIGTEIFGDRPDKEA